jgi:hypothetical protein
MNELTLSDETHMLSFVHLSHFYACIAGFTQVCLVEL